MLFQCFPYSCVLFDSREICAVGHRLCFYCYSSWVRPGLLPPNLGGILVPEPPHQAPCVWCGSAQSLSRTTEICPLRRHWRSMSNVILTETPFVWTFLFISALKLETTTVSHTDTLKGRSTKCKSSSSVTDWWSNEVRLTFTAKVSSAATIRAFEGETLYESKAVSECVCRQSLSTRLTAGCRPAMLVQVRR